MNGRTNHTADADTEVKSKQIVVRFDNSSYKKINMQARAEHRGMGEFVRHAALHYIENLDNIALKPQKGGAIK